MSTPFEQDVLAEMVMREVPAHVRTTMTEEQIKAVKTAVADTARNKRHAVDIRFVLPLFFTKLYFVLLVGKDTRSSTLDVEDDRRARAGFHMSGLAVGVVTAIVLAVVFAALYVIKSKMGIDLFEWHLSDMLSLTN